MIFDQEWLSKVLSAAEASCGDRDMLVTNGDRPGTLEVAVKTGTPAEEWVRQTFPGADLYNIRSEDMLNGKYDRTYYVPKLPAAFVLLYGRTRIWTDTASREAVRVFCWHWMKEHPEGHP